MDVPAVDAARPDRAADARVNLSAVERRVADLAVRRPVGRGHRIAWLVKALTCVDLTTLAGDDTPGRSVPWPTGSSAWPAPC